MPDSKLSALSTGTTPDFLYGIEGGAPKKYSGDGVFNVKDFGAVGDSTNYLNGTDDRAAIQSAINAAMAFNQGGYSRGGTVYFPPGIYRVSAPIVCQSGGGISIAGAADRAAGIGGSFPDYVISDELNIVLGRSIASIRNLNIQNTYKNYLTSCSYVSVGGATSSAASIAGTVLTVGGTITGTFAVGQLITGASWSVAGFTVITSLGSGTGGAGTYNLNKASSMSGAITATDGGKVTFGTTAAHNVAVGDQFHVFATYPRLYNGRYVAIAGTTGSTLIGVGNCQSNPGSVTMLGTVGGGGLRMDNADMNTIDRCFFSAYNGAHLGGANGYGSLGIGAYNAFGITVKDTKFQGTINGEYGSVGAFCGQVTFIDCAVSQLDMGLVASSNGFGFIGGHLENNNIAIVLGRDDQLTAGWACGAWNIISNHTEDCGISVDIVNANQGLMAANQWTGQHAAPGSHAGINFTGTTASSTTITAIPATVVTGNTTIRSPRITNLSTLTGLYEGMAISGAGIPAGSTILTIDSSNSLTFVNAAGAGTPPDPIGASATGSTVSITATVAVGMRVSGTNIPADACVSVVGSVGGGTYQVTLNKTATGAGTSSFNFNPTPTHGMRLGSVTGAIFSGNNTASVSASVAGVGIGTSNCTGVAFIGHSGTSSGTFSGLGAGWQVPQYPASPSAAGITYINCDNPSMSITFSALPGQVGQSLATAVEGMTYDITDCSTATFLATAAAGGTGATARRRVRYNGSSAVWQVIG